MIFFQVNWIKTTHPVSFTSPFASSSSPCAAPSFPSPPFLKLLPILLAPLNASSPLSAPQDSQHSASRVPVGGRAAGAARVCCPGSPPRRHPHLDQDLRAWHLHHAVAGPRECLALHLATVLISGTWKLVC